MSYPYTSTESTNFTVTHATHIAAKVATDLKRLQRFYGKPSDNDIAGYETEMVALLKAGYLDTISYGFKRGGEWIEPMLRYTARELGGTATNDDDPGRVRPGADTFGASFCSFLIYSATWYNLTDEGRATFESELPFQRTGGSEPGVNGYLQDDRIYSAGGRTLSRASVKTF